MFKDKILIKLSIIACLCLVLLIPTVMIRNIIEERKSNHDKFEQEFTSKWGAPQRAYNPIFIEGIHSVLPEEIDFNVNVNTNTRERGLFQIEIYSANIQVRGKVNIDNPKDVRLVIPLSDANAFKGLDSVIWNGREIESSSYNLERGGFFDGEYLMISLPNSEQIENVFSIKYQLEGHSSLIFSSSARDTRIDLKTQSENIGFIGDRLPTSYELSKEISSVNWKYINPFFKKNTQSFESAIDFGLTYRQGINLYQKVIRASKYSILFIGLTFLVFFFVEIFYKKSIHPIQYLLVGFALLLFYILLLSFSEQIGFMWAYIISASASIILISLYTKSITKDLKNSIFMALFQLCLYLYLYVVVLQDEIALLLGSMGLFVILASIMYSTRNFNWYTISKK